MELIFNLKNRNIFLSEEIDQESVGKVIKEIIEINENDDYLTKYGELHSFDYIRKPIKLYVDSFGGSAYQCLGLISVMEKSVTPIHTIVTGAAMSAAFMILINGHKRFAYRFSTPLYHQVSSGVWGELKYLEDRVDETRRLQKLIEKMVVDKTDITKEKLKQVYTQKIDWYITASEALKLNVIDEII